MLSTRTIHVVERFLATVANKYNCHILISTCPKKELTDSVASQIFGIDAGTIEMKKSWFRHIKPFTYHITYNDTVDNCDKATINYNW